MNWHRNPALCDRLAAEYTLGTLAGGARRRFVVMMQVHPDVARAVARWDARLAPLGAQLPELDADDALWDRIAERSFGRTASTSTSAARQPAHGAVAVVGRWWQRWLAPIPAAALSLGLVLGVAAPVVWQLQQSDRYDTQLPESYVGVLATAQGRPGLIVSSLRRGRTVDLKVIQRVALPPGSQLMLWTLDAQGVAQAVGPLPSLSANFVSLTLVEPAETSFNRAVELAVSIEPAGPPPAAPSGDFVYRGLCGKLWPVAPQAASKQRK